MGEQDLMDVVRMRIFARQRMLQYLENMFEPTGVIDIGVDQEFERVLFAEEREFQVAVLVARLETARSHITRRWFVQNVRIPAKEVGGDGVNHFISKRYVDFGEEAVSAHTDERRHKRRHRAPGAEASDAHLCVNVQQSG